MAGSPCANHLATAPVRLQQLVFICSDLRLTLPSKECDEEIRPDERTLLGPNRNRAGAHRSLGNHVIFH